jgi:hypothetical protein
LSTTSNPKNEHINNESKGKTHQSFSGKPVKYDEDATKQVKLI